MDCRDAILCVSGYTGGQVWICTRKMQSRRKVLRLYEVSAFTNNPMLKQIAIFKQLISRINLNII